MTTRDEVNRFKDVPEEVRRLAEVAHDVVRDFAVVNLYMDVVYARIAEQDPIGQVRTIICFMENGGVLQGEKP